MADSPGTEAGRALLALLDLPESYGHDILAIEREARSAALAEARTTAHEEWHPGCTGRCDIGRFLDAAALAALRGISA